MPDTVLRLGDLVVTPVVTDVLLAKAYIKMLEDETLDVVFHQKRPTMQEYLAEYLTQGRRITLGCFREIEGREPEFCGLGWAFGTTQMGTFLKCELGEVFFKRQSRRTDNLTFGRMMLSMFFEHYKIDAVFGVTPEPNRLAVRYAQKMGFSLHGPVPQYCSYRGELCAGWISHMSREQWLERGHDLNQSRPAASS